MENAGYIVRKPNPDDHRMVAIRIRPAGKKQFNQVLPIAWRLHVRAVMGLTQEEQQTLHYLLNRIRDNVNDYPV
jgi:DNA-binding MarR family transcriptional regulator